MCIVWGTCWECWECCDWIGYLFIFRRNSNRFRTALSSFRLWFRRCHFGKSVIFLSHAVHRFYFQTLIFAAGTKSGTEVYPCNFDDSFFFEIRFHFSQEFYFLFFWDKTYICALQLWRKTFTYCQCFWLGTFFFDIDKIT